MLDTSVRMPTFLPFRRAVKAHTESLGVCAVIALRTLGPLVTFFALGALAASCASRGVEHLAEGPKTGPLRDTPSSALIRPSAGLDAGISSANSPSEQTSAGANAPHAAPEIAFEDPYPLDARPRAASPLQAAADDEELARWNLGGTADPNYPSSQASFHPGTRVVVDAEFAGHHGKSLRGPARGLSAERVQAQARRKGYWPFRLCFEAGQREKKGPGGETRIRFSISTRGNVSAARLISSDLRNGASSACLLNELRKLRFSPPPARHVEVVTSIRIWPGDAELPLLSDAPLQAVDTSKGFDPAAVRASVVAKNAELAACFTQARRDDPSLWGRLALAVVLEVDGTVHRVSEVESHFPNAGAARCAAATLSTVLFPSVAGKPFSFVFPMRLPPSNATRSVDPSSDAARPDLAEPAASPESEDAGADD
jgi:hypothetical protein